jgi:uncharacterized repeat protein (TIGR03803 family)
MASVKRRRLFTCAAVFLLACAVQTRADFPITTLGTFDGTAGFYPQAGLTRLGDTLYGTINAGGTGGLGAVYSVPVSGGVPTIRASVGDSGGWYPYGGLTLSADGNTFYGTTYTGLANSYGMVYSVPVAGGTPAVLATFDGTHGSHPESGVTLAGGRLYGTTRDGGANGFGTVYSIPVGGGTPTVLVSFDGNNGKYPYGGLTLSPDGTTLYGTTQNGGTNDAGAVFSVSITEGTSAVLASFNGSNGRNPVAALTLLGDTLYGTSQNGGRFNSGAVFSVPITGGTPTLLASFSFSTGSNLQGGLTLSPEGNTFFGTTAYGGANGRGAVFALPIAGGTPTVLASFNLTNGARPYASLTLSADGTTLYGTTKEGGASNYGTVFSMPTPEPSSLGVLGIGAAALLRRRRKG